ncbi:alpha/beta fold hydrolase [Oceanobacillus jeddahense]|uniref:alpha/beta fold hydrolase n=1 Tax=Oceanobacillus jeddahense TaxID=1462527 RepID=UPI0005960C9C|nr:alpha/beta hydrolase [Oceanobacillus jeddahense]
MYFKTSDGLRIYYEVSGTGKIPCLYLHGGPGYWSKSFQHFMSGPLKDKLQMIYLDQRGCGRSEHSEEESYSLNRLINDIEELRNHLEIEEWLIMGHSFGGIPAVNYAVQFPNRVTGIILANATLNMFASFTQQMQVGSEILGLEWTDINTDSLPEFMEAYYGILSKLIEQEAYFKLQFVDIDKKKEMDAIDREGLDSDPAFQRFVFSSAEYFQDFTLLSKEIDKPVLVISGKDDYAVGPAHYQSFKFREMDVQMLKSGHHPYVENSAAFQKVIVDFAENRMK